MSPAGLFLAVAGVWVLSQVLIGNAIGRLGIFGNAGGTVADQPTAAQQAGAQATAGLLTPPGPGTPKQPPAPSDPQQLLNQILTPGPGAP